MGVFPGETNAWEWVRDTLSPFPETTYYYSTYPRNQWHDGALRFTFKIGSAIVVVSSYYEDGIWQVWGSEETYVAGDYPDAEGIFDCDYADRNQEHWDEYVEAIEEYSGLEGGR